jgi:sodium-dependent dicarboxylate transporter 2/3/5
MADHPLNPAGSPAPGIGRDERRLRRSLLAFGASAALAVLFLLQPAPAGMSDAAWATTALVVFMAMLWLTEAMPIAATALAPLALGPLLGLGSVSTLAAPYASSLVFLLLGGFAIGLAMERCGLHRRLALLVLGACGARADFVVGGIMLATAVLSMWISNTATAAMMVPIGLSIITLLQADAASARGGPNATDDAARGETGGDVDGALTVPMLLGVAFAANIGGMATLIGTPPNAVLAGYMARTHAIDIGFAQWMAVGLPVATLLLALCWLVLTRLSWRLDRVRIAGVAALVTRERARLGEISAGEVRFAVVFGLTVLGWLFRPWLDAAAPGMAISDAGIAVIAAMALFVLPEDTARGRFLLDWPATRDLPWGVLLLVGGGLSLGGLIQTQGLADYIGQLLSGVSTWPLPLSIALVSLATMMVSHVASNTATAAALTPVAAALALTIGAGPLSLALPLALAASCAFMMPVATPPNAIAHGTGLVTTAQMARAGAVISVLALGAIVATGVIVAGSDWP